MNFHSHPVEANWTDQRVEMLKSLWADGLSGSQIANELGGISKNAVISKIHRIGLARRRKTPARSRAPKAPVIRRSGLGYVALHPTDVMQIDPDPITLAPAPPEFLGIPFTKLNPSHCRYPRGGDDGNPITFCGQPKMKDSAYCPACHANCHNGWGRVA